jgi:hypothetical protein
MQVKVTIPTSLKDIKLSQYQRFIKEIKDSEDEDFIGRKIVSIFCKIPEHLVDKVERKTYNKIVNDVSQVLQQDANVITKFNLNGKFYGLIPSIDSMTVGEQADLDAMYNDYEKRGKVMAILYRPITMQSRGKYMIAEYTGKEEPLDVSMDIVKGADVFFCNILNDCISYIQNCIEKEVTQTKKLQVLEKSGIGTAQFMESLKETFSILQRQLNYH